MTTPPTACVVSIVFTPRDLETRRPQDRYARVAAARVTLVEFKGIAGDAKAGAGQRQINIMAAETLAELRSEGFKTEPGQMGEQIVVAGIDPATLAVGSRWRLGSAVVEVTLPRTGCGRFEMIQGKPKGSVTGRLGVLARVVTGGKVAVGDAVEMLPALVEG